jgi:2-oxo-4-hydroxy-4-carboxy-5-ureidoimidazoline decarboxylase
LNEGLARFNALPTEEAEVVLLSCFPNRDWAARVVAERPYPDPDILYLAAGRGLLFLTDAEWLAAFGAHPRIGERGGHEPAKSEHEQSGIREAPDTTLAALATENRAYEERFGHVFMIAAAGRSAEEILTALRSRMRNRPDAELEVAKGELQKIMLLRLERWLDT